MVKTLARFDGRAFFRLCSAGPKYSISFLFHHRKTCLLIFEARRLYLEPVCPRFNPHWGPPAIARPDQMPGEGRGVGLKWLGRSCGDDAELDTEYPILDFEAYEIRAVFIGLPRRPVSFRSFKRGHKLN